jgi:SNF2 family DNA or RNA helicase
MARKSTKTKKKKQKISINQHNWNTTDADEILRRQIRADNEKFKIKNKHPVYPYFSVYAVSSSEKNNKQYTVEIRSLDANINSCNCPDYRTNHLGTCKHIEAVLKSLRKKGVRKFKQAMSIGSKRVEIFLEPSDKKTVRVLWPNKISKSLRAFIDPYFSADGTLLGDTVSAFEALSTEVGRNKRFRNLRISQHIQHHVDYLKIQSQKLSSKEMFLADVKQDKRSMDLVKYPLLPYQREGMLHLAFTERALLADEMGLGKTVQAIAACKLLNQLRGVQRVLVVTTASLKAEWEEQIEKFTDLSSHVIFGAKPKRLKQYQDNHFFYLMNYEQVISDHAEIQRFLAPDVVILDEAQRIKNWRTKTASAIKELKSRYAFVLTGTPVENRIDDIYSIVQFLDPYLFGPLFRFNRDFYELDDDGRPIGYKNLDELYRRLRSIMLCRKKQDVENELPKRLSNNYFVSMEVEQRIRYEEYEGYVARLMHKAKRQPLRKEEFEKLQKWLACMRMICDTPYILDKNCRISPKLMELETILKEQLEDAQAKIIVFSEWERMLYLVKELADENDWGLAWHTGSVPQKKRRENINRFKKDSNCRLFLSTDAGSVGLNLQVANVVVNLDLPWNPAKLEQRIARAWRKHQKRSVQVINLVCENSIEHRMLYLLEQKQLMAKSVLTGDKELKSMKMPSGRAAFMERMEALMADQVTTTGDVDRQSEMNHDQIKLKTELVNEFNEDLKSLYTYQPDDHRPSTVLAIVKEGSQNIQDQLSTKLPTNITLETIDPNMLEVIKRLAKAGILTLNTPVETLYDQNSPEIKKQRRQEQLNQAMQCLSKAARQQRMAKVLIDGDFADEAMPPLKAGFSSTVNAFLHLAGRSIDGEITSVDVQSLIDQYSAPACFANLFSVLVLESGEVIEIEKLLTKHQLMIDCLAQMKMDMDTELKKAFSANYIKPHAELEVV